MPARARVTIGWGGTCVTGAVAGAGAELGDGVSVTGCGEANVVGAEGELSATGGVCWRR